LIRTVTQTASTNSDLLNRLTGGEFLAEGDWLIADRQTGGRGRQGRPWVDGAGNFMGSTIVRLAAGDPTAPTLALVAGLAVHEAVLAFVREPARVALKWPNDILLDRAKLGGVLLEARDRIVVAGFGVNLAHAPDLPDRAATSLAAQSILAERDLFAQALATSFAQELVRWRAQGTETLIHRWQAAALPAGTPLVVHGPAGEPMTGTFAGLAPDGSLRLRLEGGAIHVIHAGDVMLAEER